MWVYPDSVVFSSRMPTSLSALFPAFAEPILAGRSGRSEAERTAPVAAKNLSVRM